MYYYIILILNAKEREKKRQK
eukprot:COSAG06_NODE_78654_length_109_cov_1384.200000_1_plen_20_part_01